MKKIFCFVIAIVMLACCIFAVAEEPKTDYTITTEAGDVISFPTEISAKLNKKFKSYKLDGVGALLFKNGKNVYVYVGVTKVDGSYKEGLMLCSIEKTDDDPGVLITVNYENGFTKGTTSTTKAASGEKTADEPAKKNDSDTKKSDNSDKKNNDNNEDKPEQNEPEQENPKTDDHIVDEPEHDEPQNNDPHEDTPSEDKPQQKEPSGHYEGVWIEETPEKGYNVCNSCGAKWSMSHCEETDHGGYHIEIIPATGHVEYVWVED